MSDVTRLTSTRSETLERGTGAGSTGRGTGGDLLGAHPQRPLCETSRAGLPLRIPQPGLVAAGVESEDRVAGGQRPRLHGRVRRIKRPHTDPAGLDAEEGSCPAAACAAVRSAAVTAEESPNSRATPVITAVARATMVIQNAFEPVIQ